MVKSIRFLLYIGLLMAPVYDANASQASLDTVSCHPKINAALPQYIVGYGSLMLEKSKLDTDKNVGMSVPITITGFQRGWFVISKHPGFSIVYLGVVVDEKSKLNGVLFKLNNNKSLIAYDAREAGYCRVAIEDKNIKILTPQKIKKGQYWIYVLSKEEKGAPSQQYPIVQSYVDIFLSGCLEIQKKNHLNDFAKECVLTTSNWSTDWVNDRVHPRRAYNEQPITAEIDNLLASQIPEYFSAIKIEGN